MSFMQINDVLQDMATINYLILNLRIRLTRGIADSVNQPQTPTCLLLSWKMYGSEEQTRVHAHCRQEGSQKQER